MFKSGVAISGSQCWHLKSPKQHAPTPKGSHPYFDSSAHTYVRIPGNN